MIDRLGLVLLHSVWQGVAIAAVLALLLLAARRAPADLRYGFALAALALLVALPVATFVRLAPANAVVGIGGTTTSTPGFSVIGTASGRTDPLGVLVELWAFGAAVLSLRLVGTLVHLDRWRRRHARPAPPEAQDGLDRLARRLGVRRRVALFLSDRIEVPSAWGVLRPLVVMPASLMTGLSPEGIEGILLHELAHVRRHDYLVNLVQSVVETALFYHPAVWWVSGVVRREREHLCDDLAVAALGDPAPYARALLLLEERRRAPRPALSAKEGKLMNRIARLLAPRPAPSRVSPFAPTFVALAVVGLALGGAFRADAQAKVAPPEKSGGAQKLAAERQRAAITAAQTAVLRAQIARLQRQLEVKLLAEKLRNTKDARARAALMQQVQIAEIRMKEATLRLVDPKANLPLGGAVRARVRAEYMGARALAGTPLRVGEIAAPASGGGGYAIATPLEGEIAFALPAQRDDSQKLANGRFRIEPDSRAGYTVDANHAPFTDVVRALAKQKGLSVVLGPGSYLDVTVMLASITAEDAMDVLCKATNASYTRQNGIYYITMTMPQPAGGGGFGGGGIGGGAPD